MTIGRKYIERNMDRGLSRLLDERTRRVLNAIGHAQKGGPTTVEPPSKVRLER